MVSKFYTIKKKTDIFFAYFVPNIFWEKASYVSHSCWSYRWEMAFCLSKHIYLYIILNKCVVNLFELWLRNQVTSLCQINLGIIGNTLIFAEDFFETKAHLQERILHSRMISVDERLRKEELFLPVPKKGTRGGAQDESPQGCVRKEAGGIIPSRV